LYTFPVLHTLTLNLAVSVPTYQVYVAAFGSTEHTMASSLMNIRICGYETLTPGAAYTYDVDFTNQDLNITRSLPADFTNSDDDCAVANYTLSSATGSVPSDFVAISGDDALNFNMMTNTVL